MYGGPFTHEVDAIRDERNRAAVMGEDPDFDRLFDGVELSDGAKEVIDDIKRPVEEQVFVPHDYSHDPVKNVEIDEDKLKEVDKVDEEENPAEGTSEEESPEGDKGEEKDSSFKDSPAERSIDSFLEGLDK